MNHRRSNRFGRSILWVTLIVFLAVAVIAWTLWPEKNRPIGGAGGEVDPLLELTRTALAATESLEVEEADLTWASLREQLADDESIALNRAINRVLRVDLLSTEATNTTLTDDERKAARRKLPDAISAARSAVDDYGKVSTDAVMSMWLRSRVDLQEASLLPDSMTKSLRRDVYDRLSGAINGVVGKDSRAIILGGTLNSILEQVEDPFDGLPDDIRQEGTRDISLLSDQNPDNLFIALRAAWLNIKNQDEQAVKFVRRAQELSSAIKPTIEQAIRSTRLSPDELVGKLVDFIEKENWEEASTKMLEWFNPLNGTELVKTDRRRAAPHPLDRLSFQSLRQLSAQSAIESPIDVSKDPLNFKMIPVGDAGNVTAIQAIDYDVDFDSDLVTLDSENHVTLWANQESDSQGVLKSIGEVTLPHQAIGLIVADLFMVDRSDPRKLRSVPRKGPTGEDSSQPQRSPERHEVIQNLIAFGPEGVSVIRVDGRDGSDEPVLAVVDTETGLEDVTGVTAAIAGDLEADGDIDLVFATESDGIRMFANRGSRTFFEILPGTEEFSTDDPVISFAMGDLDRDLDLDLVSVHRSGKIALIENLLHLQFRGRYLSDIGTVDGATAVSVQEIDGNVSWDLVITGSQGSRIVFSQTAAASAWTVERIESSEQASTVAAIADFNNDTWLDLMSLTEDNQWCSLGPWGFDPMRPGAEAMQTSQQTVLMDVNRDGRVDLATLSDGKAAVCVNETKAGRHLDARFRGIDDNKSGRVNHYALGSVLELRFGPHYRAHIVTSPATHFGVDGFDSIGTLRAILPNGLTQTIRDPKVDTLIEEKQTLKGSCPYLYAWDGEKFVFKTDCLWAAPLGLQVARGVVAKDRPWEYLKIDGSDIRPKGDGYEFRITEELWEVAYFDEVALTVVDHPADVDVWTNEKVGPPEIAEPTIYAFHRDNLYPPDAAVDTAGRDVRDKLAEIDRDFVQGFDRRYRQGLCPPHWIDVDFSTAIASSENKGKDARTYLVMTGWILPTDTSLNIQIDQNPSLGPIEFPSVWVPDANEKEGWRQAIPYMGFPGGKTKTIVVDVTDVMIKEDPRIRVRTSAQIYWDAAQLVIQSEPAEIRAEDVALKAAEVTTHGFSKRLRDDPTHPEWYDYETVSTTPRWPPLRGRFSQLGDCMDLIRTWDDQMVVIGGGDEIRLVFDLPKSEPPDGWVRDFVLHSVGWDKDADLNTLAGQSSFPLPYREMTEYPPTESMGRPDTVLQKNQHHLQRRQSFRDFWHR